MDRVDVDFTNESEAEAWFEEQSIEMRCAVTSRGALRVLAHIGAEQKKFLVSLALTSLRATLIPAVRGADTKADLTVLDWEAAALSAARAALSRLTADPILANSYFAASAAHFAAATARSTDSALSAARSATESKVSADYLSNRSALSALSAMKWDAAQDRTKIATAPLWAGAEVPEEIASNHEAFVTFLRSDPAWAFWLRFYDGMWNGTFDEWPLALDVIGIEEEDWEQGYQHIGKVIAGLALQQQLRDLRTSEFQAAEYALPHRSHNNPPELVNEPQLLSRVVLVWGALDTLDKQSRSKTPDIASAQKALSVLKDWFHRACIYLGRKIDLGIDTTIKWAIPVGGGYLLTSPEKLQKVIELAEAWLKP